MLSCLGIAGIVLFTMLSLTKLPNKENNGFVRNWLKTPIYPIHQKIISPLVTRISGGTNHRLFFSGNDPRWVIMTDYSLQAVDSLVYGVGLSEKLKAPNITVDSPNIYMYSGEASYIFKGRVEEPVMDTIRLKTDLITRFSQLSTERLAIRGIDKTQSKQVFKLLNCYSGEVIKEANPIEKQQFGGFDTEGYMQYDKSSSRIIFLQTFQNRFFCLDTNLNLLYKTNTIDTNQVNPVVIDLVNAEGETKLMTSKARQSVNNELCIGNGYIFVLSALRADNEKLNDFNRYSPVDTYHLKDGSYMGSFSIPKLMKKKISKIAILNQQLVVLYRDGLAAIYNLPPELER